MIFFPPRRVIRSPSPARTSLAGLAEIRLTSTLPPSHAVAARLRLLKKRAAQSHLSTRTSSIGSRPSYGKTPFPGLALAGTACPPAPAHPPQRREPPHPRQLSCPMPSAGK